MPSVDVVVPCYQYGRYLRDCVTSVLEQGIQDLRVLIIDNASTDNSLEVAYELAAEDFRVEVVAHPTNLGHHASFNEGIKWAASDFFIVLCADDLLAPGCLHRAVSFMQGRSDVHLVHGRSLPIYNDDSMPEIEPRISDTEWQVFPGKAVLEAFCQAGGRYPIGGGSVVVRTAVQKRVGFYRSELSNTDDVEMWMRFAYAGNIAKTSAVQGIRRIHPVMSSAAVGGALYAGLDWDVHFERALESFFANEGASPPEIKRLHRTARRSLAGRAYWGAFSNLVQGNVRLSVDHWKFAFTRHPATMIFPPIGYLLRREDSFKRIAQVMKDTARRMTQSTSDGHAGR
jgi:glycosyltransferase involved in cell wall biosynthesis